MHQVVYQVVHHRNMGVPECKCSGTGIFQIYRDSIPQQIDIIECNLVHLLHLLHLLSPCRPPISARQINRFNSISSHSILFIYSHKMSDKISITKLIGQCNYKVWSLRIQSLLVHGSLSDAIVEGTNPKPDMDQKALANIRLTIEDGPLLQIKNSELKPFGL